MSSRVLKGSAARQPARVEWRSLGSQGPAGGPSAAGAAAQPALELAQLERQAYERGFRDGQAEGARQGLQQFQRAIQAFAETASQLASYKASLRSEVERELAQLSLAVARKILRRELTVDPNVVLAVVHAGLRELESVEIYRLRLNPQDVPAVSAWFEQHGGGKIQILPDPQVSRGGALFETAQGQLDARLDTQLGEIERGLADTTDR